MCLNEFRKILTLICNARFHSFKLNIELFSKSTRTLRLHMFNVFIMRAGDVLEKSYIEMQ